MALSSRRGGGGVRVLDTAAVSSRRGQFEIVTSTRPTRPVPICRYHFISVVLNVRISVFFAEIRLFSLINSIAESVLFFFLYILIRNAYILNKNERGGFWCVIVNFRFYLVEFPNESPFVRIRFANQVR